MAREDKCDCIFPFLLLLFGLVALVTLECVGVEPRFYIQELYILALTNSHAYNHNATNLNTSIIIDLKFERVVAYIPLRYKDLNITVYYGSNRSFAVGYDVVQGFKQGTTKKTVRRRAVVEAGGLPREFRKISSGSTVELATKYQLRRCGKYRYHYCYHRKPKAAVVAADGSGAEVSEKAIRIH